MSRRSCLAAGVSQIHISAHMQQVLAPGLAARDSQMPGSNELGNKLANNSNNYYHWLIVSLGPKRHARKTWQINVVGGRGGLACYVALMWPLAFEELQIESRAGGGSRARRCCTVLRCAEAGPRPVPAWCTQRRDPLLHLLSARPNLAASASCHVRPPRL